MVPLLVVALTGCSTRAQRLYRRAEAFLAQGQIKLAAQEYQRVVEEYPRDAIGDDALYKLAYVYAEEMGDPSSALVQYRRLADRYPSSPYADEALMRVLEIQRRVLHDPPAAKTTAEEVCRRFSDREQLCATACLEVARAEFDQEQYQQAIGTAQGVIGQYSGQTRQCAQAALLVARATEQMGGSQDKVESLYEDIIRNYPDTHSAATAKVRLGWMHYGAREQDKQKEADEKKRQSRTIKGVPPHGIGADTGQLQALSALRSLLAHRGETRELDELLALSGVAFQFVFDPGRPTVGRGIFAGNPFETVAQALGFAPNVWSSANSEQAFASVHQALLQGHPVIILYDAPPTSWVVVTGYELTTGQVYLLPAGRPEYTTVPRETFLSRWASSDKQVTPPMAPGPFYQFSLGARLRTPPEAGVVRDTLQHAVDLVRRRELSGVPAGQVAYERLAAHLESCGQPEATEARRQALRWAEVALPAQVSAREAGLAYLKHAAQVLSGAGGRLNDVAQRYDEVVAETSLLSRKLREARAQTDEAGEKWEAAAAQARYLAALEARAAEQLSTVLASLAGDSG